MSTARAVGLALALALGEPAVAQISLPEVPPEPPGGYPVGCSNVEQNFAQIPAGESALSYWEGRPDAAGERYVTDLLVDPAYAVVFQQQLPPDLGLFGVQAGRNVRYAALVCYPTSAANGRAAYPLPTGESVPHMQRGAEPPIFPADGMRYPVVVYSHGLSGSPLSPGYLASMTGLASYGFVVVGVFHGDLRFADIDLDTLADVVYAALHFKTFVAMQAARPLSLRAALDVVLAHPGFRDRVDPAKVGGYGVSLGGESLLLMAGAGLTTGLGQAWSPVTSDTRLRAAVGYIPWFGLDVWPAFGRDLKGLDGVTLPYLALSGTADATAPIAVTERGIRRLAGTRRLVALTGLPHGYDPKFADDINTWGVNFLGAQLGVAGYSPAVSARMTSVSGGGDDFERVDYTAPTPVAGPGEALAVEYYNGALGHYFMTADTAEIAMLDAGAVVPGWQRTGYAFKARPAGSQFGLAACRFYGTPPAGPNSHFYTIDADECAKVKANPLWTYEGIAFNAQAPVAGDCAVDRVPVLRLYNNGMGGQANHRFETSRSEVRALRAAGWIVEGTVFCAIP